MARDRAARPGAKPLRLFVAIDVPPAVLDAVTAAIEPWRGELPGARWVPTENWHVTTKFLGWVSPRLATWVVERVGEVAASLPAFSTRLTGLGAYPSARRARVLWAGLDDERAGMADVAGALDSALAEHIRPEGRPFAPHLTIARSDPPVAVPAGLLDTPVEPVAFEVQRLTLYRSHLGRPAPRYEVMSTVQLGGEA